MEALKKVGIIMNRKMLAELAVRSSEDFNRFLEVAKEGKSAS
jgi:large subunit ribosomal protein L20